MYEELFEAAGANARVGSWEDKLPEDERELLPLFKEWLVNSDSKAEATATAYRSYVAQALVKLRTGETWTDLTTDIRSAVNAFIRFSSALKELEAAAAEADAG